MPPDFINRQNYNQFKFNFVNVTTDDVIKVICAFNNKKSAGWDDIPLDLLKKVSKSLWNS